MSGRQAIKRFEFKERDQSCIDEESVLHDKVLQDNSDLQQYVLEKTGWTGYNESTGMIPAIHSKSLFITLMKK